MATVSTEELTKNRSAFEQKSGYTDSDEEEEDDEYLRKLESFARQARQNGEELVPDGSFCAKVRRRLIKILHSFACNVVIISLASLDALILMAVLLLEIEALKMNPGHTQNVIQDARFGLECVSISIICIFMIEIGLKLFALGPKHFFSHWIEVIDAIVTVISLVVDALVIADHVAHFGHDKQGVSGTVDAYGAAAGLLIVFRTWRIIRILNATMVTMSAGLSRKLQKMKTQEIYLQRRIFQLERRLMKHNIPLPHELEEPDESDSSHPHLHLNLHFGHHKKTDVENSPAQGHNS